MNNKYLKQIEKIKEVFNTVLEKERKFHSEQDLIQYNEIEENNKVVFYIGSPKMGKLPICVFDTKENKFVKVGSSYIDNSVEIENLNK